MMDSGEGKLKKYEGLEELHDLQKKYPNHGGTFHVGEIITLKSSKFRIKSIKPRELRLKLLPKYTMAGKREGK
jgi:uncharacterized Zn finger protein